MLPRAGNLQKIRDGKRTYAITPSVPGGFIKPQMLRKYAEVAEKYHATLKMTSAQRMMIIGLNAEDVDAVWDELGLDPAVSYANCVRSVKLCPGSAFCKRGVGDSIKLGLELDRRYHKKEMPSRMKIGVAGCPNSCSEVHIKDIGLFATEAGWTILAGGSCGRTPRLANKIIEDVSAEQALDIVDAIVEYYKKHADIERIGQMIDRIGLQQFQEAVLGAVGIEKDTDLEVKSENLPEAGILDEGGKVMKITKDSIIGEVIREFPGTISIFRSHGMGCLGCPSASGESIEKAAGIHGIDIEALLIDLNKVS